MNLMALNRNQTKEEKKASAQKRVRARAMQASGKSSWKWQSWKFVDYVTCGSSVGDVQNVLASAPNRRLLSDWWCVLHV